MGELKKSCTGWTAIRGKKNLSGNLAGVFRVRGEPTRGSARQTESPRHSLLLSGAYLKAYRGPPSDARSTLTPGPGLRPGRAVPYHR